MNKILPLFLLLPALAFTLSSSPEFDIHAPYLSKDESLHYLGLTERGDFQPWRKRDQFISTIYFKTIAQENGVEELVKERLYVKKLSPGMGPAIGKEQKGVFHLRCTTLRGECLVNTYTSDKPLKQDLRLAISGFRDGVAGMRQGEKRVLYLHPDYGVRNFRLHEPSTPLIIETELIAID